MRCDIDHVSVHVAVLDDAETSMNSNTYLEADFAVLMSRMVQNLLNPYGSLYGVFGAFKRRHDGIANGLDHLATKFFNDWKQQSVMLIDHQTAVNIAQKIPMEGRIFDVREQDGNLFSGIQDVPGETFGELGTFRA